MRRRVKPASSSRLTIAVLNGFGIRRPIHGTPQLAAIARSREVKLFAAFGWPPMIPLPARGITPSTNQSQLDTPRPAAVPARPNFNLGSQNATEVLWIYGEQLECLEQISERLAETKEEIAKVQAHFNAVFCQ